MTVVARMMTEEEASERQRNRHERIVDQILRVLGGRSELRLHQLRNEVTCDVEFPEFRCALEELEQKGRIRLIPEPGQDEFFTRVSLAA